MYHSDSQYATEAVTISLLTLNMCVAPILCSVEMFAKFVN